MFQATALPVFPNGMSVLLVAAGLPPRSATTIASDPRFGERTTLPPTRDFLNASEEYEVEAILGHRLTKRKDGNRRMYLIRWKGFEPSEDSWVSDYSLRNAPEIRREYLDNLKK
jgi:hypothetical protein